MIQRIQTLWLFLTALAAAFSFQLTFYVGTWSENGVQTLQTHLSGHAPSLLIFANTIAIVVIALLTIFLYKNRVQQLWLTIVNLFISLMLLYTYYYIIRSSFTEGTMALTSVFVFAIPVFIVLTIQGIRRDIKLLKNVDRLRD